MSEEQKNERILSKKINIDIFINLLYAIIFMLYYVSLNILEKFMIEVNFYLYIKYSCMVFLGIGIIAFEVGYKKDKGKYWIHGIEFLVISFYTLMIKYVVRINELNFENYVLTSSYLFSIYYILKCMIIYTRERKLYLKGLSDIKEIVKKDEPIKKEATKKKNINTEEESNKLKKEKSKNLKKDNIKNRENKLSNNKQKNVEDNNTNFKKSSTKKNNNKKGNTKLKEAKTQDNIKKEKKHEEVKKDVLKKRGRPKKVTN